MLYKGGFIMQELTLNELEIIDGGGKKSATVNAILGYSVVCVGMCVSGPIGLGFLAGGAYCIYNGYRDKYGR